MANTEKNIRVEQSLLDEIEELQVLEAEELQEGVAFHAFRFGAVQVLDSMVLTVDGDTAALAKNIDLPQGATLTDVQGPKMRILFDSDAVKPATLKASLTKSLGSALSQVDYNKHNKVGVTELSGTKLG